MFHQPFHHQQQGFPQSRGPTNSFIPSNPFIYRPNQLITNQSKTNFNFSRDFERFSMPFYGYSTMPNNGYTYYDYSNQNFDQQRWRQNMTRTQRQHRQTPVFHFQNKSTSYFMTDPIVTSDDRLTIQLTKVHIGPNGDQQRVFVEQEFSNEHELNKFVRNLRYNFEKTFHNRSSGGSHQTDETKSSDSKKSGFVVVEEPDEEPKIYQQQVYNAKVETKNANPSIITPPTTPTAERPSFENIEQRSRTNGREHQRAKYHSPTASQISSSSVKHSKKRHKNKMKYRRQQIDNRNEQKSSRIFQMPSFHHHHHPPTPIPSHFQQRIFQTKNFNSPTNSNCQWRCNRNGYPKTHPHPFMPSINDNFHRPSPFPRFQNSADPFFRPIHPAKFPHHFPNGFQPPPIISKFHRSQNPQTNQSTTITEHLIYPNNEQQQPRVHRTKSECRNIQNSINNFQTFSPLRQSTHIQRNIISFRPAPVILTSVNSTTPMFYPNQRRQFGSVQPLINQIRNGTNRF